VLAAWKERRSVDSLSLALEHENSAVRDGAALALGEIGDARAIPALVPCLMDPEIAGTVATALSKLNWSPQTDRERVYYLAAQGKWEAIAARRETSVRILRDDLSQNIPGVSEGAAYILVAMGAGDAIPELIASLKQIGSEEMARVYWNSDHTDLQTAAAQWSADNGIELLDLQIWDAPIVRWAGRDLGPVRFNPQFLQG
jgi:HEAT repeat protein